MNECLNRWLLYYPFRLLRGENLPYFIKKYENSQWWHVSKLREYQFQKLKELLIYAKENVPFYAKKFKENNVDPYKLNQMEDLLDFPFLSREDLMRYSTDLRSKKKFMFSRRKITGGSTGQPAEIIKNPKSTCVEDAALWRNHSWYGIKPGDKQARFWGVAHVKSQNYKNIIIDLVMNRKRFSAFNFTKERLLDYYIEIQKFKPKYFYGYTSLILQFTETLLENNINPNSLGLRAIITTAEPLYDYQKKKLSESYKVPIINDYGSSEIGPIAFMCPEGNMHLMIENLFIEIIGRNNLPLGYNEIGEIVVTELHNYYMPMIRYRTRDYGSISNLACTCGRSLPVLNEVIGRDLNLLQASDKSYIHAMFIYYILEEMVEKGFGNLQVQAIQTELTHIKLNIVKSDLYSENATIYLIDTLRQRFGSDMKFTINFVSDLKREKSGKLFITKNLIAKV